MSQNYTYWEPKPGCIEKVCPYCGVVFWVPPSLSSRKYCNIGCYDLERGVGQVEVFCRYCGAAYNVSKYMFERKIGIFYCCTDHSYAAKRGVPLSDERRAKLKGRPSSMLGKHHSEEAKRKISQRSLEHWQDLEWREWILEQRSGEEYRKNLSAAKKEQWQDPNFAKKMWESWRISPNKPELYLQDLLDEWFPSEYRYVGNGGFILGGCCPDFMNVNGQKKLVELFGDYWHRGENPQERIDHFMQFGYDTLVTWESELKDIESLKYKLIAFNNKEYANG